MAEVPEDISGICNQLFDGDSSKRQAANTALLNYAATLPDRRYIYSDTAKALRPTLGMERSCQIFGDRFSSDHNEPRLARRVEQRMQAVLHEAMVWLPSAVAGQIVLCSRLDETIFRECVAAETAEIADQFRERTTTFTDQYGSSVFLDSHMLPPLSAHLPGGASAGIVEHHDPASPRKDQIRVLDVVVLVPKSPAPDPSESSFFTNVVTPIFSLNLALLRFTAGIDFHAGEENHGASGHLYLLCRQEAQQPHLLVPATYLSTFERLLAALCAFHTTQMSLDERDRVLRYKDMFLAVQAPLRSLTEAQERMLHDAQNLRVILYAPIEGIFGAAPLVLPLFRAGNVTAVPGGSVTAAHQTDVLPLQDARWTLACFLSRMFGRELAADDAWAALHAELAAFKAAHDNPGHRLHRQALSLVTLLNTDRPPHSLVDVFALLGKLSEEEERDLIVELLLRIKERMCHVYDPGHTKTAISIPTLLALLGDAVKPVEVDTQVAIAPGANPLYRQGPLLEFICGVVLCKRPRQVEPITLKAIQETRKFILTLTADSNWLEPPDGAQRVLDALHTPRQVDFGLTSDFLGPFLRLPGRLTDGAANGDKLAFSLTERLTFVFKDKRFQITSE